MYRYPLILSIENHCSVDQQKKMAEYMQKVFKGTVDSHYEDITWYGCM